MKLFAIAHMMVGVLLLSHIARAKYIGPEDSLHLFEEDDPFSNVGIPSTSTSHGNQEECKKDILILLDTSHSIGKEDFNNEVKPFLRDFVSDKTLNVGPNGAQVALLLFSKWDDPKSQYYRKEDDKTKLVIPFNLHYDAKMFERYINNTEWRNIKGGHTRTDKALEIANKTVFPEESPLNNRKHATDVIILITDGKPQGTNTVVEDAIANAKVLKEKGILIIGVGVGQNIEEPQFWKILQDIASPGQAIRVKINKFRSIKDTLVKSSCQPYPFAPAAAQRCDCPGFEGAPIYLKPGETSTTLSWKRPDPVCPSGSVKILDFTWQPIVRSPAKFGVGKHRIDYKFYLSENQEMNCSIVFDVKVCECPREDLGEVQVKPGETKVDFKWQVPVPSCLNCLSPLTSQSLSVGKHSMAYKYNVAEKFNVTCQVNVEIKGALCNSQGYNQATQDCCCGVIHDKKFGYACCGQNYYNIGTHQCCDGSNIRNIEEGCLTSF